MKCINCGKEINDDARFCQYCGKEQPRVEKEVKKDVEPEDESLSDINKESDSIRDADKWTRIIYYFLYVVCSLAFVLIVGGSIYYIVSPNLQNEPETNVVEADSTDVDEMLEDSLPVDEPVKAAPEKAAVIRDTIPETPEEAEPVEPAEPEVTEPVTEPAQPATDENKTEEVI